MFVCFKNFSRCLTRPTRGSFQIFGWIWEMIQRTRNSDVLMKEVVLQKNAGSNLYITKPFLGCFWCHLQLILQGMVNDSRWDWPQVPWDWPMLGMLSKWWERDLGTWTKLSRHFFQEKTVRSGLAFESLGVRQQQFCAFFVLDYVGWFIIVI